MKTKCGIDSTKCAQRHSSIAASVATSSIRPDVRLRPKFGDLPRHREASIISAHVAQAPLAQVGACMRTPAPRTLASTSLTLCGCAHASGRARIHLIFRIWAPRAWAYVCIGSLVREALCVCMTPRPGMANGQRAFEMLEPLATTVAGASFRSTLSCQAHIARGLIHPTCLAHNASLSAYVPCSPSQESDKVSVDSVYGELGDGSKQGRPRLVVLGSGWGAMSFVKALPASIR